jgi:lipoprotein-releasing system ATP-binding protein
VAELVEALDLTRRYGEGKAATTALRGVSVQIRAGEYLALIGRSGSGKSTLLNLLGLLDRPSSGTLRLLGRDISTAGSRQRARLRSRHIGFVFQAHHLLPEFDVRENVLMPMRIAGRRIDRRAMMRVDELLGMLGLEAVARQRGDQLSGGQKQRVAIGRALVNEPQLVLADEPTGNLDTQNAAAVNSLFRRIHEEWQTTFVIVTHDPGAADGADRVLEIHDGSIVRDEELTVPSRRA